MSLKRSLINLGKLSAQDIRNFVDSLDVVLTDCDGVLWKSNEVIDGAVETLDHLRKRGKKVYYLTNNSTRTREMFISMVHKLGFHCRKEDILSTAYLAADYLKSLNFDKKVYIVGAVGIARELDAVGIKHTEVGPDVFNVEHSIDDFVDLFHPDPDVGAVVVGFDMHISLPKIIRAVTYLDKPEVLFVATNTDERLPLKRNDVVLPGAGCMLAAVQLVAKRQPFIIGKPATFAYEWLKERIHIRPERTLMIGDSYLSVKMSVPTQPHQLINLATFSHKDFNTFMASFNTAIIDTHGVLWVGSDVVDDAHEALTVLRQAGKRIFFMTNNSTKSRDDLLAKTYSYGFECSKEELLTSGYVTAQYLRDINFKKKVYMIGSEGLAKELDIVGIPHLGCGPDPFVGYTVDIDGDPQVGAVVIGLDEHLSYPKLLRASVYLSNEDVLFIATNSEDSTPYATNLCVPGAGFIVKALERCTRRSAYVIGKPNPYVQDVIKRTCNLEPNKTLVIGDGCNTDVLLGTRCGFQTLLVLTGVTKLEDVKKWKKSELKEELELVPDFYIDSIGDLVKLFNQ